MQEKYLKDVVASVAGEDSSAIVDLLYNKKNVNEFLISKKLNLTINQTRNILYKLADEGLVSFVRKKDKRKGGWYTYYWSLNALKSLERLSDGLTGELKELEENLHGRKTRRYYYDVDADVEYSEDVALEYNFISPETGEVLQLKDSSGEIEVINERIGVIENVLKKVNVEIQLILKKDEGSKKRRLKRELKIKEAEKLAKKKIREREKKKLMKGKKVEKKVKKNKRKKSKKNVKDKVKKKGKKINMEVKKRVKSKVVKKKVKKKISKKVKKKK